MTDAHWQRLEQLFHDALEIPAADRRGWLEQQCPDDRQLVQEVMHLLANHDTGDHTLEEIMVGAARGLEAQETEATDRRLGAYRVVRRLGQGGMGTVYLAERDDAEYRQQVAIKLIRGFPDEEALGRLRRERQILADLNHSNIARLLDGGTTDDGQPYLVMEYVHGTPIVHWCREHELSRRRRIQLMLAVCDAIHYAHQHLIIHRDIKPGNVLVTDEGRPMLLDFGIAKLISEPGAEATQTQRYYTPGYASPEQLSGQNITTAADIYSLGRLLLALLDVDVRDPATTGTADTVFRRAAWKRRLPRDLVAIIDQATRTEPERRYATVAALRADLAHYLEGRAVSAVPDRFGYRLRKFAHRNRFAVTAAAIAVFIGLTMMWRLLVEYERARTAESVARVEALRAEQTSNFVLGMLGSIDPEYADGADTALMRRVLDDAATRAPRELADQPLVLSDIQYVIGRTYHTIGLYDQAREHLTLAAALSDGAPGSSTNIKAHLHLVLADTMTGQYDEALARIESVLAQTATHLSADHPLRLDALHNKADLLIHTGDYEQAEPLARQVIESTEGTTDPWRINIRLESIRNLAQIHSNLSRFERSTRRYEQVRAEAAAWADPAATRHITAALNDQAIVLLRQQQYAAAEPLLRESLALHEQFYGEGHPLQIHALGNLASSLRQQGRLDEARPVFERALSRTLEVFGPDHPTTLMLQYNMGNLLRVQGEADEAAEIQRTVLARGKAVFPQNHPVQGMFRLGLGQSELARGDAEAAIPLLREALDSLTEHYGPDYHRTVEARQALNEALEQR